MVKKEKRLPEIEKYRVASVLLIFFLYVAYNSHAKGINISYR